MMRHAIPIAATAALLSACSVWPVNQDPDGIRYRQNANHIIWALQKYRDQHGSFPTGLDSLVPGYMPSLPDVPALSYHAANGSLSYRYIPTWPQLRWTWCDSVGDSTNWRCAEHII
ncbi:MAG: hypothetical protein KGL26_09030 [Pseudomonadota bacterium]|nr:hypothetical protein [Pseudomonadota bacterium]